MDIICYATNKDKKVFFFIFSFNKYKCGIEIKINKVCFQIKIHSQLSVKVVLLDIAI